MAAIRAASIVLLLLAAALTAVPLRWAAWLGCPAGFPSQLFCRALLGLIGIRLDIRGRPLAAPRLVVANHVSWIDILALGSVEPVCFLAKREVADWPLIGALAVLQGTVFVDRARRRTIPKVNRAMARRLASGRSVVLFPEGTTQGVYPGPFKTAHLACLRDRLATPEPDATAMVQPVALRYSDDTAAWVGDATLLPHLWMLLKRPRLACTLAYGEALVVQPGFDRKRLGRALAQVIGEAVVGADVRVVPASHAGPVVETQAA